MRHRSSRPFPVTLFDRRDAQILTLPAVWLLRRCYRSKAGSEAEDHVVTEFLALSTPSRHRPALAGQRTASAP